MKRFENTPLGRITLYHDILFRKERALAKQLPGVYAAFRVHPNTAKMLRGWAKRNRVENIMPADELHVTTVYSKKPIDYKPMGKLVTPIKAKFEQFKLFGEDGGVLVAHIEHSLLHARFKEAKKAGATWDFPSYVPHVTISAENSLTEHDLGKLTPIDFPIVLTEEYSEPLED